MDRFFFAFGSGARVCLGGNIRWMEMSKLAPTLFSKFDLQLANPEASWKETCWQVGYLFLKALNWHVQVVCETRQCFR
jgi:cytochrome P450